MESKHILLTTDLSPEAERAFGPTSDLALGLGASVTLLHVHNAPAQPVHGGTLGTIGASAHLGEDRERALTALERQAESLPEELDLKLQVVTSLQPAAAVVEFAEENGVGLIALSTHGRSGISRALMGSVAEQILRKARVPVLCFPPESAS